jgi:ribonuclease HII
MSTRSPANRLTPDFSFENGIEGPVCGLDEVGRGPLAGPVVAACVYIPKEKYELVFVNEIRDSKKLAPAKLEKLNALISEHFVCSVAEVSPEEIDTINILQASLLAMKNAFENMAVSPSHALVDGNRAPKFSCKSTPVIKGDNRSVSIAAASIIAKVHRDRLMERLAAEHPHYGWERNVGYPTAEHLRAIEIHGITDHHRRSFGPVRDFISKKSSMRETA